MSELLLPVLAVVAGLVSFSSPCVLPLLPGYVSFISALPTAELDRAGARMVVLRSSLAFVGGFTLVFTALGVSLALLGAAAARFVPLVVRITGLGVIVMGLAMAGWLRVPWLWRERRMDLARFAKGPRGAFAVGMAFAAGWTPCIGPVLATILAAAAATGTATWGAILLVLYSLGLGVPFIAVAVGMQRARGTLGWLRRHGHRIEMAGGVLLIGVGILFVSGAWEGLFRPLQRVFARTGWPPI
ncbi:MAG: cytochrome c biogenesis CcdA family protein [Acidimicrobiales bacterium]